jgi:hypothetical protein
VQRLETGEGKVMTGGPGLSATGERSDGRPRCVSERGEGEWIPFRVLSRVGRGPNWQLGRIEPPRPFFFFFSFSFSVFPISFISFALKLQKTSNQLLKLSKIQEVHLNSKEQVF